MREKRKKDTKKKPAGEILKRPRERGKKKNTVTKGKTTEGEKIKIIPGYRKGGCGGRGDRRGGFKVRTYKNSKKKRIATKKEHGEKESQNPGKNLAPGQQGSTC